MIETQIDSLMVATDGSGASGAAEHFALGLAARSGARLSGFTVIEDRDLRGPSGDGLEVGAFPAVEVEAYYRARARAVADRFAERARAGGVNAICESAEGIADDRIVERAQAVDLLVLGREGKSRARRQPLVGSTANGVIRKAVKSTLVVPMGAVLSGPIVLGFDGSPGSRIAAGVAVRLANGLGEAVHVFVDSKDKGRAVARFEEVRQLVGGLSVPVRETSSTLGRPDAKLVDTARAAGAGLIVMGAYGRNRITEFFLGSNAAAVVRTSPIAVLLAR